MAETKKTTQKPKAQKPKIEPKAAQSDEPTTPIIPPEIIQAIRDEITIATGNRYGKFICPRCENQTDFGWRDRRIIAGNPLCRCGQAYAFVDVKV
jgi:hypothetical protein